MREHDPSERTTAQLNTICVCRKTLKHAHEISINRQQALAVFCQRMKKPPTTKRSLRNLHTVSDFVDFRDQSANSRFLQHHFQENSSVLVSGNLKKHIELESFGKNDVRKTGLTSDHDQNMFIRLSQINNSDPDYTLIMEIEKGQAKSIDNKNVVDKRSLLSVEPQLDSIEKNGASANQTTVGFTRSRNTQYNQSVIVHPELGYLQPSFSTVFSNSHIQNLKSTFTKQKTQIMYKLGISDCISEVNQEENIEEKYKVMQSNSKIQKMSSHKNTQVQLRPVQLSFSVSSVSQNRDFKRGSVQHLTLPVDQSIRINSKALKNSQTYGMIQEESNCVDSNRDYWKKMKYQFHPIKKISGGQAKGSNGIVSGKQSLRKSFKQENSNGWVYAAQQREEAGSQIVRLCHQNSQKNQKQLEFQHKLRLSNRSLNNMAEKCVQSIATSKNEEFDFSEVLGSYLNHKGSEKSFNEHSSKQREYVPILTSLNKPADHKFKKKLFSFNQPVSLSHFANEGTKENHIGFGQKNE